MDGTIVNTEPLWMRAETELVEAHGGSWSHDQAMQLVGRGLYDSAEILRNAGVRLAPLQVIRHLTDRVRQLLGDDELPWRPGARELLAALRAAGIPSALVTMSFRDMAEQVVAAIGFDAFDVIVAGDDVVQPKPHPEPYLRAADLLGVPIERCVAFEDSTTGVASAVASGAATVAIPFLVPIPESDDHAVWPTLAGRGLEDVVAAAGQRVAR